MEEGNKLETVGEVPRSPRYRPKTWPEHCSLLAQVMEEVKKFEEWLKTADENLQTFIGIAVPQTLNEMKSKLREVQVSSLMHVFCAFLNFGDQFLVKQLIKA